MIELKNVTKIYNEKSAEQIALNSISLKIEEGSMVAVMGPSGSGKTTLLNILGGMDSVSNGTLLFNGRSVGDKCELALNKYRKEQIAFVFQQFSLMNNYSVIENVELPLEIRGIRKKQRKKVAEEYLKKTGIERLKDKFPDQISGGEKQRCAIARALAADVPIILADEPTGALDRENGIIIMELFKKANEYGKTIIIATHDNMVASYCERIIRLSDGILQE